MQSHFEAAGKNAANYVPLSPVSFLRRAEQVYSNKPAVVYGNIHRNWAEFGERVRAVAAGLRNLGIGTGDTVSVIAPNIPELFELHFAVPMAGAVLNTINTRLEAETVGYILEHSDCKLLIADTAYAGLVNGALTRTDASPIRVDIRDAQGPGPDAIADIDYEDLAATADRLENELPADEWQAITLNYTSGTSGRPKGVVYHHRGAYLMAMGTVAAWQVPQHPSYLSIVPMFHCNGWGHPWMMAIVGGKMAFTRDPMPAKIFAAVEAEQITHFGAAPIVLQMLAESEHAPAVPFEPAITVMTAGAPPPPAILEKTREIGLNVMQVYGLTETFGHISQCLWDEDWDALPPSEQAVMQALQGVSFPMVEDVAVIDRATGSPVADDGLQQGEIAVRGNTVMKGYYKDPKASEEAFQGGWFWSGDAAVVHSNGYMQVRDRLKDVIISGGENISSVEVEAVLYRHPEIQAAAVVAKPHDKWGEVPCAFVELRPDASTTAEEVIAFCREHLAGFKTPKAVVFAELPKTATGKIQKFALRERAKSKE